jgi:uncharacterized protein (DUF697 family)
MIPTATTETTTAPINYAERTKTANATVKKYTIAAIGVGVVELIPAISILPFPVCLALLTGVQLKMLHSLAHKYGVAFSKDAGKAAISALVGGILVPAAGIKPVSSIATLIPGVGQVIGAANMISISTIGGATTYAVGEVFIQHFEAGGTFLTFDPEKVRKHFEAEFEKGKQVVADLKQSEASA